MIVSIMFGLNGKTDSLSISRQKNSSLSFKLLEAWAGNTSLIKLINGTLNFRKKRSSKYKLKEKSSSFLNIIQKKVIKEG